MIYQSASLLKTGRKNKKNQGFTLVEMVIVVTIFAVLLGILVPSLNSVLGFEAQRATQSICASLDRTKREAMSRLVGEMKLYYDDGGYYVKYYLDRGKGRGLAEGEQEEQVAKKRAIIKYKDSNGVTHNLKDAGEFLILTYNRENGGFREIQSSTVAFEEMQDFVNRTGAYAEDGTLDLRFPGDNSNLFCTEITIEYGMRKRTIALERNTGTYTVKPYIIE